MTTDPYFQSTQDKLKAAQDALNNRQAPLIPQDNQFRTGQADLMAALQQRASGQAPSLAEQQLLSGRDANIRALQAGAASQRGQMGGGTQMRGLQQAAGNQMLQTNQQAAELRIKEQQSAEAALVQALASARGQDISIDEANQRAQIQKQAMVDDMTKYYTTLGFSNEQAQVQAQRDYEKMLMDQTYRYEALKKGIGIQERGQDIGLWSNVLGSGMKAAGDVGSYLSMGSGASAAASGGGEYVASAGDMADMASGGSDLSLGL